MSVSFGNAINAYQTAARQVMEDRPSAQQAMDNGNSFASLVRDSLQDARDVNLHAEQMQMQALNGNVDMRDLVMAVSSAEMALDTVTTVRDRVLTAYQEILRMPI